MPLQDATRHHPLLDLVSENGKCRSIRAEDPKAGINKSRTELFEKGNKDLEKLPPTEDAIRANHQAKVWLQANVSWQTVGLPSVTKGWELSDQKLKVVWTTKASIPSSCMYKLNLVWLYEEMQYGRV